MRVLAIDPGYERLGIAIVEDTSNTMTVRFSQCFQTSRQTAFAERLTYIREELEQVIRTYEPDACAIETLMFSANRKTALMVAHARGVILETAARHTLPIFEYAPQHIKIAVTSHGGSSKQQVITMVQRLCNMQKPDAYDDEYDAVAVGITCLAHETNPVPRQ